MIWVPVISTDHLIQLNPLPDIPATSWRGILQLEFTHAAATTEISHRFVQAPLKVQRPFYPEGADVCHTVMLHTAGGVVGGDRLSLDIQLHPQAQTLMTTAAATKIYRSNGAEAQQTIHTQVAAGACLEWLPQETIVFDGAQYRQMMRVDLADNALWMGWDIVRLGRTARGERFTHGNWRSHTEVWQSGRPLWIDPQWIKGGSDMITSSHGLAGCPVIGTFALIGRSVDRELVEQISGIRDRGLEVGEVNVASQGLSVLDEVNSSPPPSFGVTRLMSGLLCRYRGHSTAEARRWFTDVWGVVRSQWCDRPACKPRVW